MVGLSEIDGEPAMLSFQMGIEPPIQGFGYLLDVDLIFKRPNGDGFPEPDEHNAAFKFRERLIAAAGDEAQLIGTITGGGHRNHALYTTGTIWIQEWENSERSRSGEFVFEATVTADSDWDFYRRMIRETERAHADVATVKKLEESGANLLDPLDIDWWFYFPNEENARLASESFAEHEYTVEVNQSVETSEWLVTASLHVRIDLRYIIRMSAMFSWVAKDFGGRIDGWGAQVR